MQIRIVIISLAVICSTSCSSYTPFTQSLYDTNGWTERDLERIQFYVSEDLILQRNFQEGDTRISGGKIQMKDGRRIERVIIPKHTPGVLIDLPSSDRFVISFDPESDAANLRFGPNPSQGRQYLLLAKDWNRGRGRVLYDGREYTIMTRGGAAKLLVDLRRRNREDVQSTTVGGRKVN